VKVRDDLTYDVVMADGLATVIKVREYAIIFIVILYDIHSTI